MSLYADLLKAQLDAASAERDRQFWLFTMTRRGKPVDPAVTRRVYELQSQLAKAIQNEREHA